MERRRKRGIGVATLGALLVCAPAAAQDADAGVPDAEVSVPTESADAGTPEEASTEPTRDATTGIRGRIVDSRTGAGLPEAVVLAQGSRGNGNAMSDENGGYVMLVPPGIYVVSALYDLYHGARMPRVRVRSAHFTDLTLTLDPIDAEAITEEVEIVYRPDTSSANAQDQLRAASATIGEGMGSQQMSRAGASDAGGAARNVVGVTLEGTNLNVRGLGGRYTLVLLNGVPLPSTDPDVPSVDLDLFPTSVIDSLQISKAFLPDLPGNFAGGVLDIRTVRFPRQFTFELGASVGANTMTTFRDRLDYRGGDLDWLGFDDGGRRVPAGLDERLRVTRTGSYTLPAQLEEPAERFPNVWQYDRRTALPAIDVDLTLGDSINLGERRRFGYLLTAGYGYDVARTTGISVTRPRFTADGSLEPFGHYDVETGGDQVQLVGLGTASLELGDDDVVSFLTLFNRAADDQTQFQTGENAELVAAQRTDRWELSFIARTLSFNQLRGDHRNIFGSRLRLRWNVYGSYGGREEPDRRSVQYGPSGSVLYRWLDKSQSGERFYSFLEQFDLGGLTDLRIPLWTRAYGTLGGHVRYAQRDFSNRRFRMLQDPNNIDSTVYEAPIEELFDEQSIGTLTRIQEATRADDSYASMQGYYAGFAMLETPIVGPLAVTGGARIEVFDQDLQSQSPFLSERATAEPVITSRMDVDVLPAVALRLNLEQHMVLRASYGMTVARPQIRELAPYQYYDFVRDRNVQGNPDIARTVIQNADLRWEWFVGEGEIMAVSAFYKYFDDPIELQIFNASTYDALYVNALEAHNVGGELEARVSLGRIAEPLQYFRVGGNLALIWSRVSFSAMDTGAVQAERPLYGQAPYVANLSLMFDHPETGISASVIYNVVGPRVTLVGTRVNDRILPNQIREPFHSLDFVFGWRFDPHWRVRLKVKNLLYQSQDYTQGDLLTQRTRPGITFSLGLTYSY